MAKAAKKKPAKPKAKPAGEKPVKKPAKTFKVEVERAEPRGLFAHIWEARRGLAASFNAQTRQGLSEERVLAYAAFVCLIAFFGQLPAILNGNPEVDTKVPLAGQVAGSFVAVMFFLPLVLYGIAGLSHWIARFFDGQGTYLSARLAFFWSLVLFVPIGLVWAAGMQALTLSGNVAWIAPIGTLIFGFWLWIWTSFLAIAEGFSRIRTFLFMIMFLACLAGLTLLAAS